VDRDPKRGVRLLVLGCAIGCLQVAGCFALLLQADVLQEPAVPAAQGAEAQSAR
jgi:hypothetical protein